LLSNRHRHGEEITSTPITATAQDRNDPDPRHDNASQQPENDNYDDNDISTILNRSYITPAQRMPSRTCPHRPHHAVNENFPIAESNDMLIDSQNPMTPDLHAASSTQRSLSTQKNQWFSGSCYRHNCPPEIDSQQTKLNEECFAKFITKLIPSLMKLILAKTTTEKIETIIEIATFLNAGETVNKSLQQLGLSSIINSI